MSRKVRLFEQHNGLCFGDICQSEESDNDNYTCIVNWFVKSWSKCVFSASSKWLLKLATKLPVVSKHAHKAVKWRTGRISPFLCTDINWRARMKVKVYPIQVTIVFDRVVCRAKGVNCCRCCENIILTHSAGYPLKSLARCNVGKVLES